MSASGVVCALGVSPHFNGALACAVSTRSFNKKSCLDIYHLPHWTWNYTSIYRLPLRKQYEHSKQLKSNNITSQQKSITNTDNYANIMEYNKDFVDYPSVIPLPYGARERGLCFTHSPEIVFVALFSCRARHHNRYCCLMACNILNGASRPCYTINTLLRRNERITSLSLSHVHDINHNVRCRHKEECSKYKLAIGTSEGRMLIIGLKNDLSWDQCKESFMMDYALAYREEPTLVIQDISAEENEYYNKNKQSQKKKKKKRMRISIALNGEIIDSKKMVEESKKTVHRRKNSKYSVLTPRERAFRHMVDESNLAVTLESLKTYVWTRSAGIDERDVQDFFEWMQPNEERQITFSQFVKFVDDDGDFMKAFKQFVQKRVDDENSRGRKREWLKENFDMFEDENGNSDDEEDEDEEESDNSNEEAQENKNDTPNTTGNGSKSSPYVWKNYYSKSKASLLGVDDGFQKRNKCAPITTLAWTEDNQYIISGDSRGGVSVWSKQYYEESFLRQRDDLPRFQERKKAYNINACDFYYFLRGTALEHDKSHEVTSLSISGTYLVSSSRDGTILIWHLDFLLPSYGRVLGHSQTLQLLTKIKSAHFGEEVLDIALSKVALDHNLCIPNALFLLSSGGDSHVRCRDVMGVFRDELSRQVEEKKQVAKPSTPMMEESESDNSDVGDIMY